MILVVNRSERVESDEIWHLCPHLLGGPPCRGWGKALGISLWWEQLRTTTDTGWIFQVVTESLSRFTRHSLWPVWNTQSGLLRCFSRGHCLCGTRTSCPVRTSSGTRSLREGTAKTPWARRTEMRSGPAWLKCSSSGSLFPSGMAHSGMES